ncbi:uncharacterized protein Dere_GG26429 [Drosophila erecta]|uniref:Calponin-homology (CH) domain-containing protein n=1 Tax=Drosophila erecta TaxID=7220 RepID=A0A0Q5WB33_DROER|nr:uncharacterized protein Dere_GG26429 [Drosophila erecta]
MSVSGKKTIDLPKNVVVHKNEVVSIRSLLIFLNNTLDCELRGMDDLKTGAVYCQLMHRLYPETIPIQKVRFYTSSTSDFKANFRLLQNSIEKLRVTRYMSEDELIAGHNHVDFCNWMHKFFKTNDNKKEYDAKKVRKGSPIGLNKILNVAPSSTGGMNAMHKCQSMVFNYTKNAAKLERRNSLDIRASKTGIFKNIQREKQTKEPNPKPSKTKKISKTSHFLDESKNVSLPSESEDELERLVPNRNNVKKVHGTQSSTPGIPRQGPEIQVKCGSPLCKRYNQEAGDQQSKLHTVDNLERQLERLQIDNEILTKKLEAVEYLLMKYYNKPDIAFKGQRTIEATFWMR